MAKRNVTRFNVMVGTCDDLDSLGIQKTIIDAITNWNLVNRGSDVCLIADHWKISVAPSSGKRAQGIINGIIADDDDALVVCLWTKCGPGLDEEIQNYVDKGKPVMLYIYQGNVPTDILSRKSDYKSIERIKEKYGNKVLYNDRISNENDFKSELLLSLNQCVDKLRYIDNQIVEEDLKNEFSINEIEGFTIVDHAYSQYKDENLNIINKNRTFVWDIPEVFRQDLVDKKFLQGDDNLITNRPYSQVRTSDAYIKQKLMMFLEKNFANLDIDSFLASVAEKTVKFFLNKEGTNSFNGTALGVYNISRNRTIRDELPMVDIELYISDYFTFKFMSILYAELRKENQEVFKITCFNDINRLVPFFNSVGIGGFVCFDRGDGVEFLFAKRGANVSCGGYWHFTYDETFSLIDQSLVGGVYEFDHKRCLSRALKEEVIGNDEEVDRLLKNSKRGFTDVGVISTQDRLEFELCGYAYFNFNERFKYEDLEEKYKIAPDANWETSTMYPVNIQNIEMFVKNNLMTPECEVLIKRLKARVKAGKIGY